MDEDSPGIGSTSFKSNEDDATEKNSYSGFLLLIIIIMAFFGNLLTIAALRRSEKCHRMFFFMTISLACTDTFVSVLVMPIPMVANVFTDLSFNIPLCYTWLIIDCLLTASGLLHICTLAYNTQVALVHPLRYRMNQKPLHVCRQVTVMWLVSIVLSVPYIAVLFNYQPLTLDGSQTYTSCHGEETLEAKYLVSKYLPVFVAPAIAAIGMCIWASCGARRHRQVLIRICSVVANNGVICGGTEIMPHMNVIEVLKPEDLVRELQKAQMLDKQQQSQPQSNGHAVAVAGNEDSDDNGNDSDSSNAISVQAEVHSSDGSSAEDIAQSMQDFDDASLAEKYGNFLDFDNASICHSISTVSSFNAFNNGEDQDLDSGMDDHFQDKNCQGLERESSIDSDYAATNECTLNCEDNNTYTSSRESHKETSSEENDLKITNATMADQNGQNCEEQEIKDEAEDILDPENAQDENHLISHNEGSNTYTGDQDFEDQVEQINNCIQQLPDYVKDEHEITSSEFSTKLNQSTDITSLENETMEGLADASAVKADMEDISNDADGEESMNNTDGEESIPFRRNSGREKLNEPLEEKDIDLIIGPDKKKLLETNALLDSGIENLAFDDNSMNRSNTMEDEISLADAIKVTPASIRSNRHCTNDAGDLIVPAEDPPKSGELGTQSGSNDSLQPEEPDLAECGITPGRRSILKRDNSKRNSQRKSVKFASDVGEPRITTRGSRKIVRKGTKHVKVTHGDQQHKLTNGDVTPSLSTLSLNGNMNGIGRKALSPEVSSSLEYLTRVNTIQGQRANERLKNEESALHMVVALLVIYIIMNIPYIVICFLVGSGHSVNDTLYGMLQWLSYCTSLIVPVLYFMVSGEVRHNCIAVCCCIPHMYDLTGVVEERETPAVAEKADDDKVPQKIANGEMPTEEKAEV